MQFPIPEVQKLSLFPWVHHSATPKPPCARWPTGRPLRRHGQHNQPSRSCHHLRRLRGAPGIGSAFNTRYSRFPDDKTLRERQGLAGSSGHLPRSDWLWREREFRRKFERGNAIRSRGGEAWTGSAHPATGERIRSRLCSCQLVLLLRDRRQSSDPPDQEALTQVRSKDACWGATGDSHARLHDVCGSVMSDKAFVSSSSRASEDKARLSDVPKQHAARAQIALV